MRDALARAGGGAGVTARALAEADEKIAALSAELSQAKATVIALQRTRAPVSSSQRALAALAM